MNSNAQINPIRLISWWSFWRAVVVVVAIFVIVYAKDVLLTIFLGVLLAVVLRGFANWLERKAHVPARWSYLTGVLIIVAAIAALCYWLGPRAVTQGHDLIEAVPKQLQQLKQSLDKYPWGRDVTRVLDSSAQPQQVAGQVQSWASKAIAAVTGLVVIIVIGLFVGADPELYCGGVVKLFPDRTRATANSLSQDLASTLRSWLIGQLIPMCVLGVVTMIGLWLLGVPLAFVLGLLTGLLLFIPYAGSVMAYVATVLIAFSQGFGEVISVTILFLVVHLCEGYVLTPLVQKHEVKLPPALTLAAQLFMFQFAGLLGVMTATPLAAVCLVLVQRLYLHQQSSPKQSIKANS